MAVEISLFETAQEMCEAEDYVNTIATLEDCINEELEIYLSTYIEIHGNKTEVLKRFFYELVKSNRSREVKVLIEEFENDDLRADNNYAIKWASKNGHLEIVKLLAERLTDDDLRAYNNYAINGASFNGHLEIVKFLLENGVDKKLENNAGKIPKPINKSPYFPTLIEMIQPVIVVPIFDPKNQYEITS
jgi:ankyrin repeat protein